MSYARRMTRPDATQSAIVAALRQCGVQVWIIGQPTDLLTFYRGKWLPLECKPQGYKRPRADQKAQTAFLKATGTPVVKTVQEAYMAVVWPHTVCELRSVRSQSQLLRCGRTLWAGRRMNTSMKSWSPWPAATNPPLWRLSTV